MCTIDGGCWHFGDDVSALLQNSAGVGALKEELNNILISCLAEEAKRAHAAQEAIEVCRAAGALSAHPFGSALIPSNLQRRSLAQIMASYACAQLHLCQNPFSSRIDVSVACAEEGLEHLNKQYVLQENFSTSYEEVVDEVSNALQATSAANRSASCFDSLVKTLKQHSAQWHTYKQQLSP